MHVIKSRVCGNVRKKPRASCGILASILTIKCNEMNGVFPGHDSALSGYTRPEITCANEMNVAQNHAPDAGT